MNEKSPDLQTGKAVAVKNSRKGIPELCYWNPDREGKWMNRWPGHSHQSVTYGRSNSGSETWSFSGLESSSNWSWLDSDQLLFAQFFERFSLILLPFLSGRVSRNLSRWPMVSVKRFSNREIARAPIFGKRLSSIQQLLKPMVSLFPWLNRNETLFPLLR